MLKLIAAIGKNRELGKDGDLCFRIKADMKFFKGVTTGHAVLMGQKTWESIGHPLPGRENYVLSRRALELPAEVHQVHDLDEFLDEWRVKKETCFIIGGASVYAQSLNDCKVLYLTEIDAECQGADVFFPEFNQSKYTKKIVGEGVENGVKFTFAEYTKN